MGKALLTETMQGNMQYGYNWQSHLQRIKSVQLHVHAFAVYCVVMYIKYLFSLAQLEACLSVNFNSSFVLCDFLARETGPLSLILPPKSAIVV